MAQDVQGWTLGQISDAVGGVLTGPRTLAIKRPVPAGSDDPEGITFAESTAYFDTVNQSQVGAVIVAMDAPNCDRPHIRVPSPRYAFGVVLAMAQRPLQQEEGVHESACVHATAKVHPSAKIGPFAVIGRNVTVGPRASIFPFTYVGARSQIGEEVTLYPHVVIYQDVVVGARSVLHSGAVIGADGFGYAWDGERRVKIPQVGKVTICEDVEIGSCTCIDRATCGETRIGAGTKIDNLVQIGHNCVIGAACIIAGQSGMAGSCTIGNRVVMGGQVAIVDHATIGDDVVLAGRTGVFRDVAESGEYFGLPPTPIKEAMRQLALMQRLPELAKRIRALEEQVEALRQEK